MLASLMRKRLALFRRPRWHGVATGWLPWRRVSDKSPPARKRADVAAPFGDARFTLQTGHGSGRAGCPFSADFVAKVVASSRQATGRVEASLYCSRSLR